MRLRLTAALLLAAPGALAASGPQSAFSVGINLDGITDYAVESPFVNAVMQSRHWGTAATPWDEAATVDANGWPTEDAGVVILCCITDAQNNSLLSGTYNLSFTGQADVAFSVGGTGTVGTLTYNATTNITTGTVTVTQTTGSVLLALSFTNTKRLPTDAAGTGVTDVKLMRPQFAPNGRTWWRNPNQIYTTAILNLLEPFPVIRAMTWLSMNNSPTGTWSARTTMQSATQQTSNGIAWEYLADLANILHKDLWINVPDQADAAYITGLAQLMHQKMSPDLHLYVEYSNEVWNYSFPQAARNQAAAAAEVAANPNSPLAWQCSVAASCQYVWAERRIGEQIVNVAQAFQTAYGSNAAMVRPIFATQLGQTYFLSLVLPMIQQFWGPPANYLYGIAQAPYWTGDNTLDGLTANQELANAAANLATLQAPEDAFTAWATYYGLKSVTYEGGPGMSGTPSLNAKITANLSKAIGMQVTNAISGAVSEGISLYMFFDDAGTYSQYGMWGATQDVFSTSSKLAALKALVAQGSAPLTAGELLPTQFSATTPDIVFGSTYTAGSPAYLYLNQGATTCWLVDVPAGRSYSLVMAAGNWANTTTTANIAIDQTAAGGVTIPVTGGSVTNWTNTAPLNLTLTAGLHVVSINAPSAAFGLLTLSLQ